MAKKLTLKSSGIENWMLYKIRDRNYDPEYQLEVETKKGTETLFLTDQINAWSEGINSDGLMIVSAALDNHTDLDDNGKRKAGVYDLKREKDKIKSLRDATSAKNPKDAVNILIKNRFIGTTFISDGNKLIILEIYVKDASMDREIEKITLEGKIDLESLPEADQVVLLMSGIKDEDYDISSHEVKKDKLAVRTNHGKLLPDAGYQEDDDDLDGFNSSQKRYSYTYKALDALDDNSHPFEILTTLKNLHSLEKEPQNNPIRVKDGVTKEKPYYSSTIIMLVPTGTMFCIPLDSGVLPNEKLRLKKDRKTSFVLLPKNLPLFEHKSDFITGIYSKRYEFFNEEVIKLAKMSLRERLIYESNQIYK